MKNSEALPRLQTLREGSRDVNTKLEEAGLKMTHGSAGIAKEQFFSNNIKNIVSAVEALLRGEPAERPYVRLKKEFPDAYRNLKLIRETPAGKTQSIALAKLEQALKELENIAKEDQ
ncbi:hypothetical protein HZB00_01210 [Candidatus Woesearchaeota archaeon]|nr:hypothetical protein [Candidatus Woesearchaeota archaeon]